MIANMEEDDARQFAKSGRSRRSMVVCGFDLSNAPDIMAWTIRKGDIIYDITTYNDLGKRVVGR